MSEIEEDIVIPSSSLNDEDDEDDDMMLPSLEDFLVTQSGENIADGIVNSLEKICKHFECQNKILIKLYSALSKLEPATIKN